MPSRVVRSGGLGVLCLGMVASCAPKPTGVKPPIAVLKEDLGAFSLWFQYGGKEPGRYPSMVFSVRPVHDPWIPADRQIPISRTQAIAIIDELAKTTNLVGNFPEDCGKKTAPRTSYYRVEIRQGTRGSSSEIWGPGPRVLPRLIGLGQVLDGEAGEAIDTLIRPIAAHRDIWTVAPTMEPPYPRILPVRSSQDASSPTG